LNTIKKDFSIGVIVYYRKVEQVEYLILRHQQGHWAFSKGHPEAGEKNSETALRELHEETGLLNPELLHDEPVLNEKYNFLNNRGKKVIKNVDYFIAKVENKDVQIDGTEIKECRWCSFQSALRLVTFPGSKSLLKKVNEIVLNKYEI
jgi:tRNA nucleotidyltransferase (CCA-adding enzyme)